VTIVAKEAPAVAQVKNWHGLVAVPGLIMAIALSAASAAVKAAPFEALMTPT
jgi:hypothetical protein